MKLKSKFNKSGKEADMEISNSGSRANLSGLSVSESQTKIETEDNKDVKMHYLADDKVTINSPAKTKEGAGALAGGGGGTLPPKDPDEKSKK